MLFAWAAGGWVLPTRVLVAYVADGWILPTRMLSACAARGWGPAPTTPARGVRPVEPRFDAVLCRAPRAHAHEQPARPAAHRWHACAMLVASRRARARYVQATRLSGRGDASRRIHPLAWARHSRSSPPARRWRRRVRRGPS